ncbi:glycosyltransferase family 4 protein [Maribacter polysaccharolyticus]|uniref:glycosyltransferase family 4 protein n=1 Tax=Maribacter polysaccharolyticus TaxID=3020831 RepID=UPI00237F5F42|nr:glycosyltransferase family 1 protein [Maribacter polysaccharolyticus]MDE3741482.1 glycosyltransferase family 1 protein [Maribacter polysaccharolyticus]
MDIKNFFTMKISYFFRHPMVGFSIQRVFQTVNKEVSETLEIEELFLPSPNSGIPSILKNGFFARKKQGVLNHITGDAHYLLLFLSSKNTIITVHDIMYYFYLSGIKKKIWKLLFIYPLKRAKKVVFISEFAKQQVKKELDLPENRCCIIPNPVSSDYSMRIKKFNKQKPRVLHIGARADRKNLKRTILALEKVPCHLRIIGKLSKENIGLLVKCNIEYSNAFDLSNADIVKEYEKCDIVNFPSLFEGFGMPIIEGQAVGRPVITSNIAPMNQVAGEGAILVDPMNSDDIKSAYMKIITDDNLREEIIRKGLKNVKKYRVKNIANEYINLYQEIASK